MRFGITLGVLLLAAILPNAAGAAIIGISFCNGAMACVITEAPPDPVSQDPNNGEFLIWEEAQHHFLTAELQVDRVPDPAASWVTDLTDDVYMLRTGLTISSYYVQWDPGNDSSSRAIMRIDFDGLVLAFITSDQSLDWSNSRLGLTSIDYGTFNNRGLEEDDITAFHAYTALLSWEASTPGDWARIITADAPVPVPPSGLAAAAAFVSLALLRYRRT